jgi:hypothetical protein
MGRFSAVVLAAALAGCGGKVSVGDEMAGDVGAEQGAVKAPPASKYKDVGSLDGNASITFDYSATPRYRFASFHGHKGDLVSVMVSLFVPSVPKGQQPPAASGDPVAWLRDSAFNQVAMNDDATNTDTNSHIITTLPRSGLYYVVVREYSLATTTFTVTLTRARRTSDAAADAEAAYSLYLLSNDNADDATTNYGIDRSQLPGAAHDLAQQYDQQAFSANGNHPSAYAFDWNGDTIYAIYEAAEDVSWADVFDADGNFLAHGQSDGGLGMNAWSTAFPDATNP